MMLTTTSRSKPATKLAVAALLAAAASTFGVSLADANPGPVTDLQVTVSGPATAAGGADFAFVTIVDNNGPADADGSVVTIDVPPGSTNLAASCVPLNAAAVCPTLTIAGDTVTGTIPTLTFDTGTAIGGGLSITITGRFPSPGDPSLPTSVSVNLPAGMSDSNPSSNTSNINTVMDYRVDVGVVKTVSPAVIADGQPVTYTLVFTNNGPSSADGLELADNLQASGTASIIYQTYDSVFVDCAVTGGAECPQVYPDKSGEPRNASPFGATFLRFPSGATITLRYEVTFNKYATEQCGAATSGTLSNYAFIYGRNDTNPANNSSTADLTTPDVPDCVLLDLQTTKTANKTRVDLAANEPIDFTVTFTNAGPVAAPGAQIADYLTAQFASGATVTNMVCASTPGVSCPALTSTAFTVFDSPVGAWAPNATLTITYTAVLIPKQPDRMPVCTNVFNNYGRNQSAVWPSGSTVDTDQSNNNADYQFTIGGAGVPPDCVTGDVSIIKQFDGPVSATDPSQVVPFVLVVTNNGSTDATDVQISDQLFGNSLWSNVSQDVRFGTCTTTGSATCPAGLADHVAGVNDFRLFEGIIASLPAGSTVTIPYTVQFNVDLSYLCSMPQFGLYNTAAVRPGPTFTDLNPSNNQSNVFLDGSADAGSACTDVAITKTVDPTTATLGNTVTYTLRVTNAGLMPADSVAVRDALPSFFRYTSSSCTAAVGAPACAPIDVTSNVLTVTLPLLDPGDAVDIDIVGVAVGAPGTYSNTATASDTPGVSRYMETDVSTNSSQVNTQILAPIVVTTTTGQATTTTTTTAPTTTLPTTTTMPVEVTTTAPTETTSLTTPPSTIQAAFTPVDPTTTVVTDRTIPSAGSDAGTTAAIAGIVLVFGFLFAGLSRRRTTNP